jgi:hypothetical protein
VVVVKVVVVVVVAAADQPGPLAVTVTTAGLAQL